MAHLNMTYSNTNNAKPLSITMLKNHVGTLSLNFKQQPDTIFFRQHHTFVLSFFLLKTKCVYINCYYRSMLKEIAYQDFYME